MPKGRRRFEQVWLRHAEAIARYFAELLTKYDIGELSGILADLIHANQNQPS
jgi:hypothetical protein